ncbi:MAG: KH domain-containing protein [Chloroflexota bacterium]
MTRQLIEYVARSLVEYPDEFSLTETDEEGVTVYRLHVSPRDIGKVIGRRGRVARSMRILLKVSSIQNQTHSALEID